MYFKYQVPSIVKYQKVTVGSVGVGPYLMNTKSKIRQTWQRSRMVCISVVKVASTSLDMKDIKHVCLKSKNDEKPEDMYK